MFTIQGCSLKRGEILCSCTHVPEIQYTHIKTDYPGIQISLTCDYLIGLNFSSKFKFFRFAVMLMPQSH